MAELSDRLAAINRLVHEPARLVLLTALSACQSADFLFLQRLTGLTPGNLSSHIARLEEAGLVLVDKQILSKRPNTRVALTEQGRKAVEAHWKQLEQLREQAEEQAARSDNETDLNR